MLTSLELQQQQQVCAEMEKSQCSSENIAYSKILLLTKTLSEN